MKFSYKLSLAVIALLAVIFTLGGTILVHRVFQNALDEATRQNTNQHLLEKYALEADLLSLETAGEPFTDGHLQRYGEQAAGYLGQTERMMALYEEDAEPAFSNLPNDIPAEDLADTLAAGAEHCLLRERGGQVYMLMASSIEYSGSNITLLNAFNITALYDQRSQNLQFFWLLDALLLLGAAVVIFILSALLTKPIEKLNQASGHIAQGHYDERVQITAGGEIGQLAVSFNKMAEAVQQRIEALNLSMQQKDDFVSAFTHEIKTPMTTLIGYTNLLRSKECPPDVRQRAATAIFHESKRLEALSVKLLELMGLAETEPKLQCIPVAQLFRNVNRSLAMSAPEGVVVEYYYGQNAQVFAEPDLAADLIRNLVLNAMRAQPTDGKVQVVAVEKETRCEISVRDKGIGIPPDELSRITEPFYMVDKSRSRAEGGSGLGLALASRIATLHGTALQFSSEMRKGTVVSFHLGICGTAEQTKTKAGTQAANATVHPQYTEDFSDTYPEAD